MAWSGQLLAGKDKNAHSGKRTLEHLCGYSNQSTDLGVKPSQRPGHSLQDLVGTYSRIRSHIICQYPRPRGNFDNTTPVCSEDEDHVRAVSLTRASETSMCKVTSMNSLRGMTTLPPLSWRSGASWALQRVAFSRREHRCRALHPHPERIKMTHGASEGGDSRPKAANIEPLPMDIEARPFAPSRRKLLYMVDENQPDRVKDIL